MKRLSILFLSLTLYFFPSARKLFLPIQAQSQTLCIIPMGRCRNHTAYLTFPCILFFTKSLLEESILAYNPSGSQTLFPHCNRNVSINNGVSVTYFGKLQQKYFPQSLELNKRFYISRRIAPPPKPLLLLLVILKAQ